MWKPLKPGGRPSTWAVTVTTVPSTAKSTVPICAPAGLANTASATREPVLDTAEAGVDVGDAVVSPRVLVVAVAELPPTVVVAGGALVSPLVSDAAEDDPALP